MISKGISRAWWHSRFSANASIGSMSQQQILKEPLAKSICFFGFPDQARMWCRGGCYNCRIRFVFPSSLGRNVGCWCQDFLMTKFKAQVFAVFIYVRVKYVCLCKVYVCISIRVCRVRRVSMGLQLPPNLPICAPTAHTDESISYNKKYT